MGDIAVHYNIKYFTDILATPVSSVLIKEKGSIILKKGKHMNKIVAFINKDIFLKTGSVFIISLTNVSIARKLLL